MKMSDKASARLKLYNNEATDWWAICRFCGLRVEGKLKDMKCICPESQNADNTNNK